MTSARPPFSISATALLTASIGSPKVRLAMPVLSTRTGLGGHGADDGDADASLVDEVVCLQRGRDGGGALVVDVGAEVLEVRLGLHAAGEIVPALVELVVADGGEVDASGVEDVEGRLVIQRHRVEDRAADVVARADQGDVVGAPAARIA